MKRYFILAIIVVLVSACNNQNNSTAKISFADSGSSIYKELQTGGVRMIPIETPVGKFNVWTKKFGDNPRIKVLLLHGGPAATHEYMESFESFFPNEGFEFYEYDQLGSYYSDQPKDSSLWTIEHFVDEVEQVRMALGLNKDNFYLYGSSWGGILAMEYAFKYQDNLKGLVISDMMSDATDYAKYAEDVLAKQMPKDVLDTIRAIEAKGDFSNPKYMELLGPNFYNVHLCRLPVWPDAVNRTFKHLNNEIYTMMQGPSEFGVGGRLKNWSRKADLPNIKVPTLTIGARFDTMDPEHMKWMSKQVQQGRFLFCPEGSHLCMWDDQKHFFPGLIRFIKDVDSGTFKAEK